MSIEANKSTVMRQWYQELWDKWNLAMDGRINETWLTVDNLELLQQLGAIPKSSQAA